MRNYPWRRISRVEILKFALNTLLIIPIIRDSVKGYGKMPDKAWLFHPLACWFTLFTYGISSLLALPENKISMRM